MAERKRSHNQTAADCSEAENPTYCTLVVRYTTTGNTQKCWHTKLYPLSPLPPLQRMPAHVSSKGLQPSILAEPAETLKSHNSPYYVAKVLTFRSLPDLFDGTRKQLSRARPLVPALQQAKSKRGARRPCSEEITQRRHTGQSCTPNRF